jgi:hypothetical protein
VSAQNDSSKKWTFSAYGELYYSYDFAQPSTHEKEDFIYNHKRHNEINANLILVKAQYNDNSTRANLALMAGNYAQYNLSKEPTWAQHINEANIGLKLSKKNNLWLDAGILPSHLGFESAISADCWTLTRSVLAENSPYYETGLRLQYINKNEKLNLSFLLLNGWQKIQKPNYFQTPSVGLQLNYKITDELMLNYSNFAGTDKADSLNALRTFHNFYAQYEGKRKFGFIAGFDIGTDKYNTHDYGIWFSPVLIARYTLNKKSSITLRGEYYNDKHQIIISTHTPQGFQVSGLSANYDYRLNSKIQWRIEGKIYDSKDKIFNQQKENQNFSLTTNVTVRF